MADLIINPQHSITLNEPVSKGKIIIAGTYYILNLVNGKIYNGSSWHVLNRLREHKKFLIESKHPNKHLQSATNKYGIKNFRFDLRDEIAILWDLKSLSKDARRALKKVLRLQLIDREQIWLDSDESSNPKKGYNKNSIAGSTLGVKQLQEGREHSEEWKKNISKGRKGQAPWSKGLTNKTDERLARNSDARRRSENFQVTHRSESFRQRVSKSQEIRHLKKMLLGWS